MDTGDSSTISGGRSRITGAEEDIPLCISSHPYHILSQ